MTEEAKVPNNVTNQEAVTPEANKSVPQESTPEQKANSDKELNFKRLRDSNEELKRQINALREDLSKPRDTQPAQKDELADLGEDDILTKRQAMVLAQRQAKQIVEEVLVAREKRDLPNRVKQKYTDFDELVNQQTVEEFEKTEPELAQICSNSSNPYEATYKMIKLLKAGKDASKPKQATKSNDEVIEENLKKPVSSNTFSKKGGLGSANIFGSMSKEQLYKEMMDSANKS